MPSAFVYPAENILQAQDALAPVNNLASTLTPVGMNNINNNGCTSTGHLLSLNNNTQINATNNNANFVPAISQPCQVMQISQEPAQQMLPNVHDDSRYHGTELVMLYDYKAQAPDDLSVRRGELIYADLNAQTVDGWIW